MSARENLQLITQRHVEQKHLLITEFISKLQTKTPTHKDHHGGKRQYVKYLKIGAIENEIPSSSGE